MVKFKEMKYVRPDPEAMKATLASLVEKLKAAKSYAEAKAVFLEKEAEVKHIQTQSTLASVRHSIDTRDEFYDAESKFWNATYPELQEYTQAWTAAMLSSPSRTDTLTGPAPSVLTFTSIWAGSRESVRIFTPFSLICSLSAVQRVTGR